MNQHHTVDNYRKIAS